MLRRVQYQGTASSPRTTATNPAPPALGSWMGGFSCERIIRPALATAAVAACAQFATWAPITPPTPTTPAWSQSPDLFRGPLQAAVGAQHSLGAPRTPPTPTTPAWAQSPDLFVLPSRAAVSAQHATAPQYRPFYQSYVTSQAPDVFIRPFSASEQQFVAEPVRLPPTPTTHAYSPWPDVFVRGFNAALQQHTTRGLVSERSSGSLVITEQGDVLAGRSAIVGGGPGFRLLYSQDEETLRLLQRFRDLLDRDSFLRRDALREQLRAAVFQAIVLPEDGRVDLQPHLLRQELAASLERDLAEVSVSLEETRRALIETNRALRTWAAEQRHHEIARRLAEDEDDTTMLLDL